VRNLNPTKEALDFIRGLEPKPFKQVMNKVLALLSDPTPADSSILKGYENLYRVDIGEHRIVYRFDEKAVSVLVVDKRNDDAVYKKLSRKNI
jgi:mRNA interferase RelE/StbE